MRFLEVSAQEYFNMAKEMLDLAQTKKERRKENFKRSLVIKYNFI